MRLVTRVLFLDHLKDCRVSCNHPLRSAFSPPIGADSERFGRGQGEVEKVTLKIYPVFLICRRIPIVKTLERSSTKCQQEVYMVSFSIQNSKSYR